MPADTEKQLLRLIEISKEFIDLKEEDLCWQQISDYMLELSSANYIILNVYDSHRSETRRVALSGIKENIKKLIETLGFKGLGEIRGDTPYSLNNKKDIEFTNIQALSQGAISSSKAKLIQATYEIGQVVIVNIVNNKEITGNFILIMGSGKDFTNQNIVQLYASDEAEQVHAERVSLYCEQIATAMGLCAGDVEEAKFAGILHDIGKISVPDEILNKAGKLTKGEWEEIKRHTITSYNILKAVDEYAALAEAILYHHERPDGKGYPEGLKENKIPLLSKIIAVADAYESMTSKRSYKKEKTKEEAIRELKTHSGTQFDSEIVDVFVNKILEI